MANTWNAVEVLNDLLNYDKIEVGGLVLELSLVAIDHVLKQVMKPFRGPARKKDVALVIDAAQYSRNLIIRCPYSAAPKYCALRIVGDKIRLEQVIRNLLSNALKFTSALGKVTAKLEWIEGGLEHHQLPTQVQQFINPQLASLHHQGLSLSRVLSFGSLNTAEDRQVERANQSDRSTQDETVAIHSNRIVNSNTTTTATTATAGRGTEMTRAAILKRACGRAPVDSTTCKRWGSMRLSVTDDGAGLTAQQLQAICAEGVQFNANELQAGQGSGLGLFIAKGNLPHFVCIIIA